MKIIATIYHDSYYAGRSIFLVEVHGSEIETITGESLRDGRPGTEIKVQEASRDLAKFRAAKGRLESASETLRAVASLIDTASASYIIQSEELKTPDAN